MSRHGNSIVDLDVFRLSSLLFDIFTIDISPNEFEGKIEDKKSFFRMLTIDLSKRSLMGRHGLFDKNFHEEFEIA